MAEYTSNFNLEKQQGNEFVNINGINNNFDILDTELKEAQDKASNPTQINGHTVESDVPPNAKFTDTTYGNATTTTAGLMSPDDKTKLNGVATGANNYTHPANHPASIITQDANNRFVTDAEKTTWNAKAPLASPAFTGTPTAPSAVDYTVARLRNVQFSSTDLIAGTSGLASGNIYIVYE